MRIAIAIAILGIVPSLAVGADEEVKELKVGDPAPKFEMKGSDGKTYKLSDFKGKKAFVIAWFPKAFTGGCTAQCKSFRDNSEKLQKFDVAYFTASVDTAQKNTEFAKSLDVDYPILADPEKKAAKAFGVLNSRGMASRVTFYVDKDGKIAKIDKVKKAAEDAANAIENFAKLKFKKKPATKLKESDS